MPYPAIPFSFSDDEPDWYYGKEFPCSGESYSSLFYNYTGNVALVPVEEIEKYSPEEIYQRLIILQKYSIAFDFATYFRRINDIRDLYELNDIKRMFLNIDDGDVRFIIENNLNMDSTTILKQFELQAKKIKNKEFPKEESIEINNYNSPKGYVYVFKMNDIYKIGRSVSPPSRQKALGVKAPYPIEKILVKFVKDMFSAESYLHDYFSKKCINESEWFDLNEEDIRYISNYLEGCKDSLNDKS